LPVEATFSIHKINSLNSQFAGAVYLLQFPYITAETSFTTKQCFQVKLWLTFNEPLTFMDGYASEIGMAPSINTPGIGDYLAAHTVIHSHARIYHLYDQEFRAEQGGTFKEF
jgi:hypothetical protein